MRSWNPIVRPGVNLSRRSGIAKRCYHPPTSDQSKTPVALQNASEEAFHPPEGKARLRFAPSPTGYLHLGGLRTALFNHLFARKWKGKWILRIEDTDRTRLVGDAISSLQRTLDWAGLDYDEGPGRGGDVGPYIQSERRDLYNQHVKTLLEQDKAYHCFCSPDELAEIRKSQQVKKATASYDGRCRHLTEEDVARRKRAGEKFVIRFKDLGNDADLPPDMIFGAYPSSSSSSSSSSSPSASWSRPQSPTSALLAPRTSSSTPQAKGFRGPGTFSNRDKELDDFILIKGDGYPTYHFANVVDDMSMGITHVFRGEEWLPSTPKHFQLYRALGWNAPHFAHLPLLVNADGTKLSKRTGDVSVESYQQKGYEPSALINFLSLIGWDHHHPTTPTTHQPFFPISPASLSSSSSLSEVDNTSVDLRKDYNSLSELYTLPMLINSFSLERVGRTRGSVFLGKLEWLNKMHLRRVGMMHASEASAIDGLKREEGREGLVRRVKGMLREKTIFQGCGRVEDDDYVGKVLDIELPRATVLSDIPTLSVFFFLRPDYTNPESMGMWKEWKGSGEERYAEVIELVRTRLSSPPSGAAAEVGLIDSQGVMGGVETEDGMEEMIHHVVDETGMKRSGVVKVLRHALTGRKKGPAIPSIMAVLGKKECVERLEDVERWLRGEKM